MSGQKGKRKTTGSSRQSRTNRRNRKRTHRHPLFLLVLWFLVFFFVGEDGSGRLHLSEAGEEVVSQLSFLAEKGKDYLFRDARAVSREEAQMEAEGELKVVYLDVGQGSSTLLLKNGHGMLIDGGDRETSSKVVSILQEQGVEMLDYVVVSHYDSDHLAGIIGVLKNFEVATVLSPDYQADTRLYESYRECISEQGIQEIHPVLGNSYSFGGGSFTIVGPADYGHEDENNDSVSLRFQYGDVSFLFCGDAQEEEEKEMVESGVYLKSDVYLVNHHGSASSTNEEFLRKADPDYAVISCGKNNDYGHPDDRVLKLLKANGTEWYRTDLQGTVEVVTDGGEIAWNMAPCGG